MQEKLTRLSEFSFTEKLSTMGSLLQKHKINQTAITAGAKEKGSSEEF